jgi:hypothetical protein
MDITVVLNKAQQVIDLANTYQEQQDIKTSITGAVSGNLEIDGNKPIEVKGQKFTELITSQVAELATSLGSISSEMETLTNEILTEIIS